MVKSLTEALLEQSDAAKAVRRRDWSNGLGAPDAGPKRNKNDRTAPYAGRRFGRRTCGKRAFHCSTSFYPEALLQLGIGPEHSCTMRPVTSDITGNGPSDTPQDPSRPKHVALATRQEAS